MSEATPRPWRVNKYGSIGAGETGCSPIVAHVEPLYGSDEIHGDHAANAELIVRAVNSAEQLAVAVDAAKELAESIKVVLKTQDELLLAAKEAAIVITETAKASGADPRKGTVLPRLMAAIAKAEGRTP